MTREPVRVRDSGSAPLRHSASLPVGTCGEIEYHNSIGAWVNRPCRPVPRKEPADIPHTCVPAPQHTTIGILVRHGWAGGARTKLCPESRGSHRAERKPRRSASDVTLSYRYCTQLVAYRNPLVPVLYATRCVQKTDTIVSVHASQLIPAAGVRR